MDCSFWHTKSNNQIGGRGQGAGSRGQETEGRGQDVRDRETINTGIVKSVKLRTADLISEKCHY